MSVMIALLALVTPLHCLLCLISFVRCSAAVVRYNRTLLVTMDFIEIVAYTNRKMNTRHLRRKEEEKEEKKEIE